MKKHSKSLKLGTASFTVLGFAVAGVAGVVVLILFLFGYFVEKPVAVELNPAPISDAQKSVKVTDSKTMMMDKDFRTGWTQLDDSIEISMSSPDNCLPVIDKATREGKTISIWMKDAGDDCTNTTVITYLTIGDAKGVEKVQKYEAGYKLPFEMFQLNMQQNLTIEQQKEAMPK